MRISLCFLIASLLAGLLPCVRVDAAELEPMLGTKGWLLLEEKFDGARGGLNVSVNPSPGELRKKGHLFSVMITPVMWNITEHNDKADRKAQSKALASAPAKFAPGQWHTLLVEFKGTNVGIAQ